MEFDIVREKKRSRNSSSMKNLVNHILFLKINF